MITVIGAEKTLDINQHSFILERQDRGIFFQFDKEYLQKFCRQKDRGIFFSKDKIEEYFFNLIKNIYRNSPTNITLNDSMLNVILQLGIGLVDPFLAFLLNIVLEILASTISQDKKIKGMRIECESHSVLSDSI